MIRSIMIFAVAFAALAAGCSSATDTGSVSSASCVASVPASCPSTTPSYQTVVAPFMATYCNSCHAAGGQIHAGLGRPRHVRQSSPAGHIQDLH